MMPPMSIRDNYANLKTVATNMPSLGLAYVFSALEQAGCDVRFQDYQCKTILVDEILEYVRREQFDLVGMQTYISNIHLCFDIAERIKTVRPGVKIILGGPHATIFPDMIIKHPSVDFVCVGEGEPTVTELVECLNGQGRQLKDVLGLYYKGRNGEIHKNPPRPLVKDLDSLPVPKYEIFDVTQYYPAVHIRGKRTWNMVTSRGCPYKCTFCAATKIFGNRYRYHSIERSIREMRFLKDELKADALQIYDDNFTTNKRRIKGLCKRMIEEGLGLQWICYTRADALGDEEMLVLMKKAGCYMVVVGIENGNERILKLINKRLDLDVARRNIRLARSVGLKVLSSFMIGLPSETLEEIENTIRFSTSLGLSYATYPIFTPYPGTPIYEVAQELGTIEDESFDRFSRWGNGVYSSAGLNPEIYLRMQRKAFRRFYLRPDILASTLLEFTRLPFRRMLRFILGGLSFFLNSGRKGNLVERPSKG
jgi:radical SAM superfamily enzyme YgiQ (UPF0313 family)